jgi:ABC-type bacteriocin/lantibiotic exporter with double-glycine peptidase domain
MRLLTPHPERRFLAPEVIQTSTMDCGPAALKCLLEGFRISASYGRLREACQTEVDGTSIDTLEEVAVQLGLVAEQIMLPVDHLLLPEPETLPAIVVTVLPNGLAHFVVAWRRHGHVIQVMDPGVGRRWVPQRRFLDEVYRHTMTVSAQAWREWAGSVGLCDPLRHRLAAVGLGAPEATRAIDEACADPGWGALATLDAATRMVDAIVRAGGLTPGREAGTLVRSFFEQARHEQPGAHGLIPASFWSVQPVPLEPALDTAADEQLRFRGAVLVRVFGRRETPRGTPVDAAHDGPADAGGRPAAVAEDAAGEAQASAPLPPSLAAVLEEPPDRPELEILRALRADGLLTPAVLVLALAVAAAGVTFEAVLLRGLMDLGRRLDLLGQRLEIFGLVGAFVVALLLVELPLVATALRLGRRLEVRLRLSLLAKIPRLGERYFHSRLISDMTQRAYHLRQLRLLPSLGVQILRLAFQIVLTAAGIIWLGQGAVLPTLLATLAAVGLAFIPQPLLTERDMRLRTHTSTLSYTYLDALLGLVPVRTHSAERALRREHESLVGDWARASLAFYRVHNSILAVQTLASFGFAVWILHQYLARGGDPGGMLLLLYWTLNLPMLARWLGDIAQQYPVQRNIILRLLEPLGAPEEGHDDGEVIRHTGVAAAPAAHAAPPDGQTDEQPLAASATQGARPEVPPGVTIRMEEVTVHASGHTILRHVDLTVQAGEHLAIVGSSGAGKTSLVGLLLGWHRPSTGRVLVDGVPLTGESLPGLRRVTAWVDPTVQLWNRTLLDNLRYGAGPTDETALGRVVEQADLYDIVAHLPDGLQTRLGEGGGLVSGGEGQRVRLGRALLRAGIRLVVLDEPFRGLDRTARQRLLAALRRYWRDATLLCITHDVGETQGFARVVVMEAGRVVEDAPPAVLAAQPGSRYRALLDGEVAVRIGLWESADWRRLWLADGHVREAHRPDVGNGGEG